MTEGLWSAIGGIATAGLNQLFAGANSARSAKYSTKLMRYQDNLNRYYTRDSYSLMRQGLSKAGYNPLLALGSSANTAMPSASQGISDSDSGAQAVSSAIESMRIRNENKLRKSQVDLNKSQEDLNTQQTYKTFADELKARADANVSSAVEAQTLNNIRWDNLINDARLKQILADTKYTNERSRGYSASSSSSKSRQYGVGAFSVKGNYGSNDSKSSSRTW